MMSDVIPVKVVVRVRPFSNREKAENAQECVQCYVEQSQIAVNDKMFAFDSVFDPTSSQEMIYEVCAGALLEQIFKGYNCTILAYGQTGSGKTYTMGTEETSVTMSSEERGMISRLVEAVFNRIGTSETYQVSASMLEIYEEKVIDLLCPGRENLPIRGLKGAVFVQGLSIHPVSCPKDCMELLEKGCQLRSKGMTAMNEKSSRSHAIFTLCVEGRESHTSTAFKSKLHIVDLAGSERLKKTQTAGERLREGIKINEGLLALGNVISCLSDQNSTNRHIPYRDAKITHLLQDSLGGNSYTLMIACVSPADTNAEETLSTLRYADRAKRIKNKPIINVDPNVALIQSLREKLANAEHELVILRASRNPAIFKENQQDKVLTKGTCNRCDELEKENQELRDKCSRHNLQFVEEVAEISKLVKQLSTSQQIMEQLRGYMQDIKEKTVSGKTDEALQILETALALQGTIEEDGDKDMSETVEDTLDDDNSDHALVNRFAERQMMLNKEMANILNEIKQKELAYETTAASQAEIAKMRDAHAAELEQLQAKLYAMEKEKEELLHKLKGTTIHHKLSEERRRRLQELEKEVLASKKRLRDLQKLELENNRVQEEMRKMKMELIELKKQRVKMSKQLKEEEVKLRQFKVAAERSITQMKARERKRELEIVREQQAKNLQLAIYRRKYDEACACNRRLQMQLAKCNTTTKGSNERHFMSVLKDELEMAYSAAEAQVHCEVLIEQRKILSTQRLILQAKLDKLFKEPPSKRRTGSDQLTINKSADIEVLEEQIKNVEQEIELRGSELGDIQKRCTKACSDEQREQRWNTLHSLGDAKAGLEYLFDVIISGKRSYFEKELIVEEQKRSIEDLKDSYEQKLKSLRGELFRVRSEAENLRRKLIEAQLRHAQQERNMVNIWNEMAHGKFNLPDDFVNNMYLLKEAAKGFTILSQKYERKQQEMEKLQGGARLCHGRLRRRTGLATEIKQYRSLSESLVEEQKEENIRPLDHQTKENQTPVEHPELGTSLSAINMGENEGIPSVSECDFSHHPPSQKRRSKRQSSADIVPGRRDTFVLSEPPLKEADLKEESESRLAENCSLDTEPNPNETYTVENRKQSAESKFVPFSDLSCTDLGHRSIVTRDIFERN